MPTANCWPGSPLKFRSLQRKHVTSSMGYHAEYPWPANPLLYYWPQGAVLTHLFSDSLAFWSEGEERWPQKTGSIVPSQEGPAHQLHGPAGDGWLMIVTWPPTFPATSRSRGSNRHALFPGISPATTLIPAARVASLSIVGRRRQGALRSTIGPAGRMPRYCRTRRVMSFTSSSVKPIA